MKRLIIVRHAKAVPFGYNDDFSRDLTERGIDDAEKIGLRLKQMGIIGGLVIASPASRTMHTATVFCRFMAYPVTQIQQEMVLYNGLTTHEFLELLHQISDDVQTVFVFGHNPTVHQLVYNLVNDFYADMPTCATVAIDFNVAKWSEVSARGGRLAFQITPKMI